MDRKSKTIHPDKCSACLLPLPGGDLAQSIRRADRALAIASARQGLEIEAVLKPINGVKGEWPEKAMDHA